MFNIILFGPPGSGKGTQSENIIKKYGLVHLSTGDILRGQIAAKTKLGLEAKTLMDKGELVPDAVVIGMINDAINAQPGAKGFLFDGFPRTVAQAEALDNLLKEHQATVNILISLKVEENELIKRLLNRGKTSGRADDVNESIIQDRIKEYHKKTTAVADYYQKVNKVVEIKGEGSVDEIFASLSKAIEAKQ